MPTSTLTSKRQITIPREVRERLHLKTRVGLISSWNRLARNILVRYVVNDDPKQAAVVEKFWVECETNQEAIFIPVLALCELMWVLSRLYAQAKPQLIEVLEKLLVVGFFRFEQESAVRQSLENYRRGKATFPDYVAITG